MTEKLCANCGEINPSVTEDCSNCGHSEFKEVPPRLRDRLADVEESASGAAVRISVRRVVVASFLSAGLYFFYWVYLTWKQLSSEIEGTNYPFWHVMTLNLPPYGFFRLHAHVRVINELASRHGIKTTLAPVAAVALYVVFIALNLIVFWGLTNYAGTIVLMLISAILVTIPAAMAQRVLNLYWGKTLPPNSLSDARIGVGEAIIVIIGIIGWILLFLPPSLYEQP
jgi:hypothetical protein